ncbi:MAG: adenylate/guanylate cyclase domain-containing protein [Saprospiraceae bacterium]|nr:adenylate/guanylate cyclase domain-containing protein [Saprospiraceae bacterium]
MAPHPQHAQALVAVALEMQAFMANYNAERRAQGLVEFPMRAGIHSGPVVAGVVGTRKFTYDIWGDTVNTAARMESADAAGQVNISESTFALLDGAYRCTPRGSIDVKHKAPMQMYFVEMPG